MIVRPWNKIRKAVFIGAVLLVGWIGPFSGVETLFDHETKLGLQTASADTQYGIIGSQAPEPELNTWIDGNGRPMDPVKFKDFRGKVIYLYFFQDW